MNYTSLLAASRILVICLCATSAAGQTLIECGGSQGQAYYFGDDPETQKTIGWVQDGMSQGSLVLVAKGEEVDLIIRDAVGTMSASAEGANVVVLDVRHPFIEVLVSYPQGAKELYTFDMEARRVAWSQHKFGVLFDKAATFVADCS